MTKTGDDGTAGTFRWAIGQANANSGSTINFNLVNQGSAQTITLTQGVLPTLTNPTVINGYSQGGTSNPLGVWVGINGNGTADDGLTVTAPSVTIEGLAIYGFGGDGILLDNPNGQPGDIIQNNYIGTDVTGHVVNAGGQVGNAWNGIEVKGPDDTIGGTTTNSMLFFVGAGNLISGNKMDGIKLTGASATRTQISCNWIGTDVAGQTITGYGNVNNGIEITGGANANTVGGTVTSGMPAPGNDICGSGGSGIVIDSSSQNQVLSNNIGVGSDGTTKLGNTGDGILIRNGSTGNKIGLGQTSTLNVISGNGGNGVHLSSTGTTGNVVQGDYVGVAVDGTTGVGNGSNGVLLDNGASGNTIGASSMSGPSNIISGNAAAGVATDASSTTVTNVIEDNYIGTDKTGAVAVANAVGVSILAARNTIGGSMMMGAGNLISGNTGDGVSLTGNSNVVLGNKIGTDATGDGKLANGGNGVYISGSSNTIGGASTTGPVNLISGNTKDGVLIDGSLSNGGSNQVLGNYIGIDLGGTVAVGNGWNGVEINHSNNNTIGAPNGSSPSNVISGNGSLGVPPTAVNGVYIQNGAAQNVIQNNYIGADASGLNPLGNAGDGVYVSGNAGAGNTVGGTATNQGNVISANGTGGWANGWGIDFGVAVVEDYNIIGLDKDGGGGANMKNATGGSATGKYGANDKHQ